MSRGKLYGIIGSMGALGAALAVVLLLVFSRGGPGPAASSPEPVASAVGLAQASGETATSGGSPAKDVLAVAPAPDVSLAAAAGPAPYGGGPSEGIKLHGHWTIEVREPDGTPVSHTEFDNALIQYGRTFVSSVIGRASSVGFWSVHLSNNQATEVCGPSLACGIYEPSSSVIASTSAYKNLTVQVPSAGQPNEGKLVLSGTATAQVTTTITQVSTQAMGCSPPALPCTAGSSGTFTSAALVTGVAVQAGQLVAVSVIIGAS